MNRLLAFAALAVSSLCFVACDAGDTPVGAQDSDLDAAGACQWSGPGNAKYKQAVATAKRWKAEECSVMSYEVKVLAQEAVDLCPAIGPIIAESQYAGTVREALGTLEVAYLAGDLEGDEDGLNPDAVATALAGQTLWAPGQGAYGSPRIVHLSAGTYELETLVTEDEGMTIERRVTGAGTWSITTGAEGALVLDFAPEEGTSEESFLGDFTLEREEGEDSSRAGTFRFVPADGTLDEYGTNALWAANISECDA